MLERRVPVISVLVPLCNVHTLVFSTRPYPRLCASAPPLIRLCSFRHGTNNKVDLCYMFGSPLKDYKSVFNANEEILKGYPFYEQNPKSSVNKSSEQLNEKMFFFKTRIGLILLSSVQSSIFETTTRKARGMAMR